MEDYSSDPTFPKLNVYPLHWRFDNEAAWRLYRRAKREQWDEDEINWLKLREIASGLDRKQRLAIAYWWAMLSNFDNATPVFAYAVVKGSEMHAHNAVNALLTTITYDENRHNLVCGRSIDAVFPDFPNFKPQDEIERRARLNVLWTWYNGSRYWEAYLKAYQKYSMDVLFTSFMMGEAAATTVFTGASRNAKVDQFREAFKNTAVDETRHYAFTHLILTDAASRMSDEEKKLVTKQIRAGFVFLSLITYKKPSDFWKLPPWFQEVHDQMEELAREAGLGIPTADEKERAWRDAVIKVGAALKRYGVKMPAIPELNVTGEEIEELSEEDVIPVF